jgi:hydrogenase nickel incorporation protein HypB
MERLPVEARILKKNDDYARENRELFRRLGVSVINFMSAPGAGKTSVLEKTLCQLTDFYTPAVIEGDLYTTIDSDRIKAVGVPAYQITTGTCCHLDAKMIARALKEFPLAGIDTLCIENVGNMVCPAEFDLGEDLRVMVYSVVEGADKPRKYPLMFHQAHAVLLNKVDLAPYAGVSIEELKENVLAVNPRAAIFPISCRTGQGFGPWMDWLSSSLDLLRIPAEAKVCV